LFFEELHLKKDNRILLIIDDTYNEKKGKHTEYVFSWPVLWLAFGDNPILSVPMLPAPS
jgi:SRSO17 transposase